MVAPLLKHRTRELTNFSLFFTSTFSTPGPLELVSLEHTTLVSPVLVLTVDDCVRGRDSGICIPSSPFADARV